MRERASDSLTSYRRRRLARSLSRSVSVSASISSFGPARLG